MKITLNSIFTFLVLCTAMHSNAQTEPIFTSWIINTTGNLDYDNIPSDVQEV